MSITTGVKVPTSYKNIKEPKIRGIAWYVVVSWGLFFILSTCISVLFVYIHLPVIPSILMPLTVFSVIAYATVRDKKHCRQTWKHLILCVRTFRKESVFKKYRLNLDDIKKVVPVEYVNDSGIIKYMDGTSSRLIKLHAPRVSDDEIDIHNKRVMSVINSLYGEFSFQFLVLSTADRANNLMKSTADQLNTTGQSKAVNEHLYSIYEYANNRQNNEIDRDEYLIVYFPVTEKNSEAFMSGLEKELKRAHIIPETVRDRNIVIQTLRKILTCNS